MARQRGGRDYEVGGRVSLEDSFSAVAQRVSSAYGRLYGLFRGGSSGMARASSMLGGSFRYLATMLLGPIGIIAGLTALVRSSLNASATTENLEMAFTTLAGGNAQAALAHIEELRQFAIGKPFEFTQLAEQSRLLQTFGFRMGEVTGLLTDFGNAAFTANTGYLGVQRMTRVFGQMHATGKVTFGQLGMLVRSGVPAFQILRDELHLSDQELRNIARSSIPADRIIAALRRGMQQRFSGGMDRAAQTITARLSDLQDVATKFLALVGGQMRPVFKTFLDEFGAGLVDLDIPTAARNVASLLNTVLRLVRIGMQPLIGAVATLRWRWNRDTRGAVASFRDFLRTIEGTVEGAAALISGASGSGLARVPKAMRDRLVAQGLWPTAVALVRWVSRTRALIEGFVTGIVAEFERFRREAGVVARYLGIDQLPLRRTNADARALGGSLAHVVGNLIRLRIALLALEAVLAVSSGVRGAVGWTRGLDGAVGKIMVRLGMAEMTRGANGQFEAASALRYSITALRGPYARLGATVREVTAAFRGSPLMTPGTGFPAATGWRFAVFRLGNAFRVLQAAVTASGRAMLMNPITWVVGALVVSALAARYMMVHWDALSAHMQRSPIFAGAAAGLSFLLGPISGFVFAMLRARDAVAGLSARFAAVRGFFAFVRTYWAFVATITYLIVVLAVGLLVRAGAAVGRFFAGIGQWIARTFVSVAAWVLGAVATVNNYVGGFFGGVGRLAVRAGMWLVRGLFPAWMLPYFESMWNGARSLIGGAIDWIAEHTSGAFSGLGDSMLSPFRSFARELVRVYNGLPAALRPGIMSGSIATLTEFANGGGAAPPPPPQPGAAGGGAALAAAGAGTALATRASESLTSSGAVAPVVTRRVVTRTPAVFNLDGRQIANAMAEHEEEESIRRGGPGGGRDS